MNKASSDWEVYAIKYADRNSRTRADSFIIDDDHDAPHHMDYFIWVLKNDAHLVLVDTGYDQQEGTSRGRPIIRDPREALRPLGIKPENVTDIVVTHLHYDHAGGLALFPNAQLHLQEAEMQFATGPCMCHESLRKPFTGQHICEAITRLYGGMLKFYSGDAQIFEGLSVHHIGGHSKGLQSVRVKTKLGYLVLASDAAHYYENFLLKKPFPIVVDMKEMLAGFDRLEQLATSTELIIPGHDPLVTQLYDTQFDDHIFRLDIGRRKSINLLEQS